MATPDKREQLYKSLIGTGKVTEAEIGNLDEFRNAITDEASARQFHKNLLGSGIFDESEIGNADDFYGSISSDFDAGVATPSTDVTTPSSSSKLRQALKGNINEGIRQVMANKPKPQPYKTLVDMQAPDNLVDENGISGKTIIENEARYPFGVPGLRGHATPKTASQEYMGWQQTAQEANEKFFSGADANGGQVPNYFQDVAPIQKRAEIADRERKAVRDAYDNENFEDFYQENVKPVFEAEKAAGEKRASANDAFRNMALRAAGNDRETALAMAAMKEVDVERETDPKKIAENTIKAVEQGRVDEYVLGRMGFDGSASTNEQESAPLSDEEKLLFYQLYGKEIGEVTDLMMQRMYREYQDAGAPKKDLDYILGKALHDNVAATLMKALTRRMAGSSGLREQFRQQAFQQYGEDASWLTRAAGSAAPFAVDMATGGFALPSLAGKGAVKGVTNWVARNAAKKITERAAGEVTKAAAREMSAAALSRYLQTNAPVMNVLINSVGGATNFGSYEMQNEMIRQFGNGEFEPMQLLKAFGHGAALGGVMGVAGGSLGALTQGAGVAGKVAGDVAGVAAETGIFATDKALEKAREDGVSILDVDWADIAGESLGMVLGMKAVGGLMSPNTLRERYSKSPDYDLKLDERNRKELEDAGYNFNNIFKGMEEVGKMTPLTLTKTKELGVQNEPRKMGEEDKVEVDGRVLDDMMKNPSISSDTKRKVLYLVTGKILAPERVFNAEMNINEDGSATIITTNVAGDVISVKDYDDVRDADKVYQERNAEAKANTLYGLNLIFEQFGIADEMESRAKRLTNEEVGIDIDDVLSKRETERSGSEKEAVDAYIKNLQESFMEWNNANMIRIAADDAVRQGRKMQTPEEIHDSERMTEEAGAQLDEDTKRVLDEMWENGVRDENSLQLADIFNENPAARNYFVGLGQRRGVDEQVNDNVSAAVAAERDRLTPVIRHDALDREYFQAALYKGQKGYITNVSGDGAEVSVLMEGESEPQIISANDEDLTMFAPALLDEYMADYEQQVAAQMTNEVENARVNNPKTKTLPQVGDVISTLDGEQRVAVVTDDYRVLLEPDKYKIDEKTGQQVPVHRGTFSGSDLIPYEKFVGMQNEYWDAQDKEARDEQKAVEEEVVADEVAAEQENGVNVLNGENEVPVATEQQQPEQAEQVAEAAPVVEDVMPMLTVRSGKKGEEREEEVPDWKSAGAERSYKYLYEETGLERDDANAIVNNNITKANKDLEAVQSKRPKPSTNPIAFKRELNEWNEKVKQAEDNLKLWTEIQNQARRELLQQQREEADRARTDVKVRGLGDAHSLEEEVMRAVYELGSKDGVKLAWEDDANGTKGVGSHIGAKGSEEKTSRKWMLGKREDGALYPEEFAERLVANADTGSFLANADATDVFNILNDVIRGASSRREFGEEIVNMHNANDIERQEDAYLAEREAEERQMEEDATDAFIAALAELTPEEEQKFIQSIIDEYEQEQTVAAGEAARNQGGDAVLPQNGVADETAGAGTDARPDVEGGNGENGAEGVSDIKQEKEQKSSIQGLENYSEDEILGMVRDFFESVVADAGEDAEIVDMKIVGSRANGDADADSDLDVLVEYKGDAREDNLFNMLAGADEPLVIDGIKVDINPITKGKSGTIAEWLKRNEGYKKEEEKGIASPVGVTSSEEEIASEESKVNVEPTEGQKKAGNYKKGHIKVDGFNVTIENPKGSIRRGTDANGREWEQEMHNSYGYIRGTEGVDGDHIDVFLSDYPDEGYIYVIDQVNPDGTFDEHKVMYGFDSVDDAMGAYLSNYEEGWQGLGAISRIERKDFKKWIDSSDRKTKPFSEYYNTNKDTYIGYGRGIKQNEPLSETDPVKRAQQIVEREKGGDAYAGVRDVMEELMPAYRTWYQSVLDGATEENVWKAYSSAKNKLDRTLRGLTDEQLKGIEDAFGEDYTGILSERVKAEEIRRYQANEAANKFNEGLAKQGKVTGTAKKPKADLDAFTDKKELRPAMNGVYYDPDGYAVASDGFVLVADKTQYDKKNKGKIVLTHKMGDKKQGDVLENDKFPKWRTVIPSKENLSSAVVNWNKVRDFLAGAEEALKARWQEEKDNGGYSGSFASYKKDSVIGVKMPTGEIIAYNYSNLCKFADAASRLGINEISYGEETPLFAEGKNGVVLAMPMSPEWLEKDVYGQGNVYYELDGKAKQKKDYTFSPQTSERVGEKPAESLLQLELFSDADFVDWSQVTDEPEIAPFKNGDTFDIVDEVGERHRCRVVDAKEDRWGDIKVWVDGYSTDENDYSSVPSDWLREAKRKAEKTLDERLLEDIDNGEKVSMQEYDRRHFAEYTEETNAYWDMLEREATDLDDAYSMFNDVYSQWKSGGYKTAERTKLLAQMDALQEYIDKKEMEREEEEERAMAEQETTEAESKETPKQAEAQKAQQETFEEQKKEIRSLGYDLTKLRLRPLKKGETSHVERRYVENGSFGFTGTEHIESTDDVAFIFRQLQNAAVENVFVVLVKDGVPTVIHVGMGGYLESAAAMNTAFAAYKEINPDKVFLVHNHPSGKLVSSRFDRDLMTKMQAMYGDKMYNAGIIIDTTSGKYGLFDASGDLPERQIDGGSMPEGLRKEKDEMPVRVFSFSQLVFDADWNPATAFQMRDTDDAAKFISSHRLGEHKKMSLLVLTNNANITGNVFLPWTNMKDASTDEAADMIATYMHQMGGTSVLLYGNTKNADDVEYANVLKKKLDNRQCRMIDVVRVNDSMMESGMLSEPEMNEQPAVSQFTQYERDNAEGTVNKQGGLAKNELSDSILSESWRGALHVLGRNIGRRIVILSGEDTRKRFGNGVQGFYDKSDNTLYLNEDYVKDNENLRNFVLGHEMTHILKSENPEVWNAYVGTVKAAMGKEFQKEFDKKRERYDAFIEKYNKTHSRKLRKLSDAEIEEEVCSDWAGRNVLTDEESVKKIIADAEKAGADPVSLTKRILDAINQWLAQLKQALKNAVGKADEIADNIKFAEQAKKLWQDMYNVAVARQNAKMDKATAEENSVSFSLVYDPIEVARLESEPKEVGYRNVVLNEDGTLGSPMADKLGKKGAGRKKTSGFEMSRWEKSDENPDLVDENGKIDLIKPDGKTVGKVDYNPYVHIRPNKVNKQFKQAWERPNLVYVETQYPASELTSGFHAEKAKKSVGMHDWNGGKLILSRWDKPVRIVPWEEVADDWVKEFKDRGVEFDIVPPAMLPILADRGVEILPPHKGMGKECVEAYKEWKEKNEAEEVKFSLEEEAELDEVNERFNQELDDFKDKKHKGLMHLGKPLKILQACGVNAKELTLSPTILHNHLKKQGLTVDNLKGLAKSIQTPIFVYKHGKNFPNMVVVTEMDVNGGKLSASLELDKNGNVVEISNIKSIHSKDAMTEMERLSNFSEEELKNALRWVDKEKVSDWLLRLPYEDERTKTNPKHISIAKVIQDFENPKLSGEKISEEPKFSLADEERRDQEYADAVSAGETEKALSAVEVAAKMAMPNTKVVDENGEPKVVYHGSKLQEFYYKDGNPYTRWIDRFNVFNEGRGYFTDNETDARNVGRGKTGLYSCYLNIKKPFVFDAKGARWDEIEFNGKKYQTTDSVVRWAKEHGEYDGVIIKNVIEPETQNPEPITDYVAFSPNQIKSAWIEYDDNGKLVPLSKRFSEKDDIRFSLADEEKREERRESEESKALFETAKKRFGTTLDIREAGYVLPDGSMLDFSGRHSLDSGMDASYLRGGRTVDHREVANVLNYKEDGNTPSGITTSMSDFIERGAIRIDSNAGTINLFMKPTSKQKGVLRQLVAKNDGYVSVDFGNGDDSEHYVEYENVRPLRVLSAIDKYYDDGIKPESNIRFSLADEQLDGEYADAVSSGDMEKERKLVEEAAKNAGYTIRAYHGTARKDRVGNVFRPERATSGPMAFFTDSREIAENYSHGKPDTSIGYDSDYDDYETQFRAKHKKTGKDYSIWDLWGFLPFSERAKLAEQAGHIREDWDGDGDVIYDPETKDGNGAFRNQVKDYHGNVLRALVYHWLKSGQLWNKEADFLKVLEKAGVNEALDKLGFEMPRYLDPEYRDEGVYDVYLKMENPFDATEMVDEKFIQGFEEFAAEHEDEYVQESKSTDGWDKNDVTAENFAENMRKDIEDGRTNAWTAIPDVATAYLKSLGFDGIKDKGGKYGGSEHTVYVPFSSEQVKSAALETYDDAGNLIPLSERYNESKNDIRFSLADDAPFYSNAEKAVENIKQEKATAEQWLAMIQKNGGLKAGEDKWLGLSDWLNEHKSEKLTKQDVLDFIRQNQIQVEEVQYVENTEYEKISGTAIGINDRSRELEEEGLSEDEIHDKLLEEFPEMDEMLEDGRLISDEGMMGDTVVMPGQKAGQINNTRMDYTTEGLDNKREIALIVPTVEPYNESDSIHFGDAGGGRAVAWVRFGDTIAPRKEKLIKTVTEFEEPYKAANGRDVYMPKGERNGKDFVVYGKVRDGRMLYVPFMREQIQVRGYDTLEEARQAMNAWYKENNVGKTQYDKVLVIDEIQSKRHQDGREKGYEHYFPISGVHAGEYVKVKDEKYADRISFAEVTDDRDIPIGQIEKIDGKYRPIASNGQRIGFKDFDTEQEALDAVAKDYTRVEGVPDAPFDKNWHELAMKRMLRYAAENGYDKVAWTKGEQQAERYNIGNVVSNIDVTPYEAQSPSESDGHDLVMTLNDGTMHEMFVQPDGTLNANSEMFDGKKASEVFGKGLAEKIMSANEPTEISGDGLRIGGEGMKGFYDQILPRFMDKYGKKWGVKTGEVELPNLEESAQKMWSVDVTPEMKESVMQGQPMFSLADDIESVEPRIFSNILTKAVLLTANSNKDNLQKKADAIKRVVEQLEEKMQKLKEGQKVLPVAAGAVRSAATAQKEYDRGTVNNFVEFAKVVMDAGMMDDVTKGEVKRLLNLAKGVVSKEQIEKSLNAVADLIIDHSLRESKNLLKKQLSVKGSKVDSKGVEVQGKLDVEGQRVMSALKDGMKMDREALQNRLADVIDRMGSNNEVVANNASSEYEGLMLAKQYLEDIKASETEESELKHEYQLAKDMLKEGEMDRESFKEFEESFRDNIRQMKMERIEAYQKLVLGIGGNIAKSFDAAKAFKEAEQERIKAIQHNANSDLEGTPATTQSELPWTSKLANAGLVRFFMQPVATFDEMLRFLGQKSVDGRGYLWNRYMTAWTKATDQLWNSTKEAHDELDKKVKEIFAEGTFIGKDGRVHKFPKIERWSDLFSLERKMEGADVEYWDDGKKTYHLSEGKLLYIYMVNKMKDGEMKLRKMGITEADVEAIKDHLNPSFIELADWIQSEFLPKRRVKYNEVYKRMFGADMAAIDNYFPLKIDKNALNKEEDISAYDGRADINPATITGSVIKRTRNASALDLMHTDAFDLVLSHLDDMERWAAFAEFNRDLNTLLSYKKFRNRLQNMTSGRFGAGKTLLENFKTVAAIAGGAYRPHVKADSVDSTMVNLAKGVTAAKISLRVYTAFKQLLSYPAYLSEANLMELAKSSNPVGAYKAWNWAMENLPLFAERWQSRQAGDYRLKETDMDWQVWKNDLVRTAARIGMSPNAFVDAMTVAMGAKAVYETARERYIKDGYDAETANEKALLDASIAYNETQQSSQSAFMSAMQLDRTAASVALTVFRNASMAYERRMMRALHNMKNRLTDPDYKDESRAFMQKMMEREGVNEEQAKKASKRMYRRQMWRDIVDVAVFGYILQAAWNLAPYLPYLIAGDDDDERKKMLEDALRHAMFGGIEGLTGGSLMSEVGNLGLQIAAEDDDKKLQSLKQRARYQDFNLLPLMSDLQGVMNKSLSGDKSALVDGVNLLIQSGIGVNPQTFSDGVVASVDAFNGDLGAWKEFAFAMARIFQAPSSSMDMLYIDELGMFAHDARRLKMEDLAKRWARYKMMKENPLLRWAYTDDEEKELEEKLIKRFENKVKERVSDMDDKEVEKMLIQSQPGMEQKLLLKEMKSRYKKEAETLEGEALGKAFDEAELLDERKELAKDIAKEEGASRDPYGAKTEKAHEQQYQLLRTAEDVREDAQLLKMQEDAEAAGNDARKKAISKMRSQVMEARKGLGAGDDEKVMETIRKSRRALIDELGKK